MSDRLTDLIAELDAAADLLLQGDGGKALLTANRALADLRGSAARADWMTNVIPFVRSHRFAFGSAVFEGPFPSGRPTP